MYSHPLIFFIRTEKMTIKKAIKHADNVGVSKKTTDLMVKVLRTLDEFELTITLKEVIISHSRGKVVLYDW